MSQYAQRASVAFHTQLFFKSRGNLNEDGFILFVRKNAIIILIPKFWTRGHRVLRTQRPKAQSKSTPSTKRGPH
uniref:Uncharacterized protein n=1 Tax=Anguilla anguilla TaxID=7936 RepID=A0A0E9VMT8_ANGAN